jgi:hypothetical protein
MKIKKQKKSLFRKNNKNYSKTVNNSNKSPAQFMLGYKEFMGVF